MKMLAYMVSSHDFQIFVKYVNFNIYKNMSRRIKQNDWENHKQYVQNTGNSCKIYNYSSPPLDSAYFYILGDFV